MNHDVSDGMVNLHHIDLAVPSFNGHLQFLESFPNILYQNIKRVYLTSLDLDPTSCTLGFLNQNLKNCPEKLCETVYIVMCRSVLEYTLPIWNPHLWKNQPTRINTTGRGLFHHLWLQPKIQCNIDHAEIWIGALEGKESTGMSYPNILQPEWQGGGPHRGSFETRLVWSLHSTHTQIPDILE